MTTTTRTPLATFNIVIYHDGDYWVGHCVELDLVTSGTDPHSVREDAVNVCTAQVIYALGNGLLDNLLRPPNQQVAKMMLEGQLRGELDIKFNTRTFDHQQIKFRVLSQANAIFRATAKHDYQLETTEYVATEGLLVKLECDWRAGKQRFFFQLEERDTKNLVVCRFRPELAPEIGAEGQARIFVEGMMITTPDGKRTMEVASYRIIPQPISTEELHRLKLRVPGNMDASEYIRSLRADIG